jgi:hypothetical protein
MFLLLFGNYIVIIDPIRIPGQICVLHSSAPYPSHSHCFPPNPATCVLTLILGLLPPPQSSEHSPYSQLPQTQSTTLYDRSKACEQVA